MLRSCPLWLCPVLLAACGSARGGQEPASVRDRHGHATAVEVSGSSSPEDSDPLGLGPHPHHAGGSGGSGGSAGEPGGGGEGGQESGGGGGSGGGGTGGSPARSSIAFEDQDVSLFPEGGAVLGPLLHMGGGMGLIDLDGDGDLDLLVTSERLYLRAYRNDGNYHFSEFGSSIGIPFVPFSTAVALGDCDGDGSLEIFVSRLDVPQLYHRGSTGRWTLVADAGLDVEPILALGAAFADVDGDGDLDIVQTVYHPYRGVGGDLPRIWINDGACRFYRAPDPGLRSGEGVDVGVFDYDLDGAPDLLVATDFGIIDGPTRLYRNLGGHFESTTEEHGILVRLLGMGVGIGDLDGDGLIDAYVAQVGRNPFFHNLGGGDFRDDSVAAGIGNAWNIDLDQPGEPMPYVDPDSTDPSTQATRQWIDNFMGGRPDTDQAFATTGWTALIADYDADGFNDLLVTNGWVGEGLVPEGTRQHSVLYQGSAAGFTDVSAEAGLDLVGTHKGAALGDLDGDGLPDLALFDDAGGNPEPRHAILRNVSTVGHFLRIDLEGKAPNTWGIGARVEVLAGGRLHVAERTLHSGIYSASADSLFVGMGMATMADTVTVYWPWGGGITTVNGVPAGQVRISQP